MFGVYGEDVTLPYNGSLSDCNTIQWYYNRYGVRSSFDLLHGGNIDNGVGRRSLASDCSLNIYNITVEDCGIYTGFIRKKDEVVDYAHVFLHVLNGEYFIPFCFMINLIPMLMFHFVLLFSFSNRD